MYAEHPIAVGTPNRGRTTPFADAPTRRRARMSVCARIAPHPRAALFARCDATPCTNVDDDDGVGRRAGGHPVVDECSCACDALCLHDELMREATRAVHEAYAICDDARDVDGRNEPSSTSTSVEIEAKAYCTSCKRHRDAREDFYPDRKTCKPCLDRHVVNSLDYRARMARKRRRDRGRSRRRR